MSFWLKVAQALYFMLPAFFANMAPIFVRKLSFLDTPVDFGGRFRGQPIFGSHKTWKGLVFGALAGMLVYWIQTLVFTHSFFRNISAVDYSSVTLWLGFALGLGAVFGDLVKSFFKRRMGIRSGKPWIPFDQLDFVVGALLLSMVVVLLPAIYYLIIIVYSPLLHILTNHAAFYLHIRKEKW